jgi:HSP20 family protein
MFFPKKTTKRMWSVVLGAFLFLILSVSFYSYSNAAENQTGKITIKKLDASSPAVNSPKKEIKTVNSKQGKIQNEDEVFFHEMNQMMHQMNQLMAQRERRANQFFGPFEQDFGFFPGLGAPKLIIDDQNFFRPGSFAGAKKIMNPNLMNSSLKESKEAYNLDIEMPGMEKSDIQIEVKGNQVMVSGEKKQSKESKDTEKDGTVRTIRSENYYGKMSRSYVLPSKVDEEHIDARYENGVLHITLPKLNVPKAKKIEIK